MGGITTASNQLGGLLTSARDADQNFSNVTLKPFFTSSGKKRLDRAANHRKVAGVIYFSEHNNDNKLQALYLPRKVTKKNEDDPFLLGTSSNKANSVRPKLLSSDVTKNVLVVVNEEDIPDGIATGKVIDKQLDTLKTYFVNESGDLKDNLEKVVVRLPVGMIFPYHAIIEPEQATFDCLTTIDPENDVLSFWARGILSHNSDLQSTLLRDTSLKQFLPPMPSTGHYYKGSPYMMAQNVDEEADDLEEEVEALSTDCNDIATSNMRSVVLEQDPTAMTVEFENKVSSPRLKQAPETIVCTDNDKYNARVSAFGACYDPATGQVTAPVLSDFIFDIRDSSSKSAQRDAAMSALSSIEETLVNDVHFLLRAGELPTLDNICLSYIAQAKFCGDAQYELDISKASGFVPQMLLPDTAATAKEKSENQDNYEAEDALGEFESKRTKLATSFTAASEITSLNVTITGLANIVIMNHLYYKFDLESNTTSFPSIVHYYVEIAKHLTSKRGKAWMKVACFTA